MYVRAKDYKDSVELEVSASSRVACSYTKYCPAEKSHCYYYSDGYLKTLDISFK